MREPLSSDDQTIEQLSDCLPIWVSRVQLLDLLNRSGGDIIEAVSDFYERETEFHHLLISSRAISSISESSPIESVFLVSSSIETNSNDDTSVKNKSPGSSSIIVTKKDIIKVKSNAISPKKIVGKKTVKKKGKKGGLAVKASIECKQPTITKFFGKLVMNGSGISAVGAEKS
ncbi:hypothetical protein GIB67_036323 [Kingdonia uniflora]|uniref:Uncharacterized protein n=1 Tax=Kingdonia uniflora TaxID=39325 RepID=A0A7J7L3T7_9MAGN|nr:hypothetical protein GIB67_036323 [Kingdonia uniflora]